MTASSLHDTPTDVGNVHAVARALAAETAYPRSAIDWANHADAVTAITVAPRPKATRLVVIDQQPVDMSWRDGTEACRDSSPALFYPSVGEHGFHVEQAKAICRQCPVLDACRKHGIGHEYFGIWGSLTEKERRAERRRLSPVVDNANRRRADASRKPIAHGTDGGYRQHQQRGEEPCDGCRAAHANKTRQDRRKRIA